MSTSRRSREQFKNGDVVPRMDDDSGLIRNYMALLATITGVKAKKGERADNGYLKLYGRIYPNIMTSLKIFGINEKSNKKFK